MSPVKKNQPFIVVVNDADVYAGLQSGQTIGRNRSIFHAPPGKFKQYSLLRINLGCLSGRNAEKCSVELVDIVNKPSDFCKLCPKFFVDISQNSTVPAFGRNGSYAVDFVFNVLPECTRVIGFSGKTAGHADDGNWRTKVFFHLTESKHLSIQFRICAVPEISQSRGASEP